MKPHHFSAPLLAGLVFLVGVPIAQADPVQNALDDPNLEWQATPGWHVVAGAEALDGQDALGLVVLYDEGPGEVIETTVTGPGYFEFWWRVSDGDDENDMILEVDGVAHLQRDGDPYPWEPVRVNVPAGPHRIGIRALSDGHELKAFVDRVSWIPGGRFPAATGLGDTDGIWLAHGDWRQEGGGVDGNGDEARLSLPAGPAHARLIRLLEGPARVDYWSRSLGGVAQQGEATGWRRHTRIAGGRQNEASQLDFDVGLGRGQPAGSFSIDHLTIVPLTQPGTLDFPAAAPRFSTAEGGAPWMIAAAESWPHGTGSAALVPGVPGGAGRIAADFQGPGLLTWSWQKWSHLDERVTVTANGSPLGVFTDDDDDSGGFEPVARLWDKSGPFTVVWDFQWGENGFNPISLDDVLFSAPVATAERNAVDLETDAPAYLSGSGGAAQSLVTHDGADALEIAPADPAGRTALTLAVTGAGVLSWWWRAELPEPAEFCLGRQGRVACRLGESGVWRQSHLVIREGQEWVRWEVCANGAALTPAHRVWLDEIVFTKSGTSVAQAVDRTSTDWQDSGGFGVSLPAPWSADGTDALVLTGPHGSQGPVAELSAVFQGPATLSFSLRSETARLDSGAAWLLQVDDTITAPPAPGPASEWQRYHVHLEAGDHSVRWTTSAGAVVAIDRVAVEDAYTAWEQALPPGTGGPLDDPDHDGTPTMIEYAFGTSPLDPQPFRGVIVRDQDGRRAMEYSVDTARTGVAVQAEVSSALAFWQVVPSRVVSRSGTVETHQVELSAGQPFGRLRVRR